MNLNKAFVLGNLTRDPELRQTPNGQSVATFGVATNRMWTDHAGNKQTQTEFHNVVVWGRLAEIASQYLGKGRLVLVEGRITTRSWQDQQGQKKYRTEIVAENMQLGPRPQMSEAPAVNSGQTRFNSPAIESPISQNNNRELENLPEIQLDEPIGQDEIKVENIPF